MKHSSPDFTGKQLVLIVGRQAALLEAQDDVVAFKFKPHLPEMQ